MAQNEKEFGGKYANLPQETEAGLSYGGVDYLDGYGGYDPYGVYGETPYPLIQYDPGGYGAEEQAQTSIFFPFFGPFFPFGGPFFGGPFFGGPFFGGPFWW